MTKFWNTVVRQWQDSANFVLGIWLIVSPWALGYVTETYWAWNAVVVGVIIAVAAISTLVAFHQWEEWVNAALGAWLMVSAWILGIAEPSARWNQIVVGVLVGALAIWSASIEHEPPRRVAT
jgi:hypothetical protein